MQLDDRKRRVLASIVDVYVQSAVPVGSRTMRDRYFPGLSSATIRNEMSDLTELGYLEQPHISAGRVPNAKAYRLYVDALGDLRQLQLEEAEPIRRRIKARVKQVSDVVVTAAEALSDLTQYAAVVMMPRQDALRITALQLVPVSRASALVVVVTDGGIIRDCLLQVSDMLDDEGLHAISRMLSDQLRGKTLQEAQELLQRYALHAPLDRRVLEGIADLAAQLERQSASDSLRVAGSHHMLQYPEYVDVDKARSLLNALNQQDSLLQLLKEDADGELRVRIGPEHGISPLAELSIVSMPYSIGRGRRGAVAVLGPTRMPYRRVAATLSVVGDTLSQILSTDSL